MWRCGDVEVWRCGDVAMWRCDGVEVCRCCFGVCVVVVVVVRGEVLWFTRDKNPHI